MRKSIPMLLAVTFLSFLYLSTLMAETPPRRRRRGFRYDKSTVVTVQGTVENILTRGRKRRRRRRRPRLILQMKTAAGSVRVMAGPAGFAKSKGFTFAAGDSIEVTGSRRKGRRGVIIIAASIRKGEAVLRLRDADGKPLWPRRRRGK